MVSFVERVSLFIVNKCFFKVYLLLLILLLCFVLLEDKFVDIVVVHLKCFKVSYFDKLFSLLFNFKEVSIADFIGTFFKDLSLLLFDFMINLGRN